VHIRVLYFGVLKDLFGVSEERLELPEGANVAELLAVLRIRTSNSATAQNAGRGLEERMWRSLAVAVNREYSTLVEVLREDDEVALLPPVSGGSSGRKTCVGIGASPARKRSL
jgi:molybdopterin converting factor small subunit